MPRQFQFSLSGLMLVIAMIGCVLALGKWIGLVLAILLVVVPFSLAAEWALIGLERPKADEPAIRGWLCALALATCGAGIAAGALESVSAGVPTLISPLPLFVVLPLLMEWPMWTVLGIPVASYAILSFRVARPHTQPLPLRFLILLIGATGYSTLWLAEGWNYGLRYEGFEFTFFITIINIILIVALWVLWWRLRRESTFAWRVAFNTLLHLWLFWFAFPWLGELI